MNYLKNLKIMVKINEIISHKGFGGILNYSGNREKIYEITTLMPFPKNLFPKE